MTTEQEWDTRQEVRFTDKSKWPRRGDWNDEPDRIEWRYGGTPRFPLLIVRGPSGALCGYVGVPPGHPHHGVKWDKIESDLSGAHCGLTYSSPCAEGGHICHVARKGEADDVWWLGFDCAHSGDICPSYDDARHEQFASYKTVTYVRRRVEQLAEQLARVAKGLPAQEDE